MNTSCPKMRWPPCRRWRACGGNTYAAPPAALRPDLVVDGLFGIGLARPLEGGYAELIAGINRLPGPKLALDIPSGINADTGAVMGTALRATHTITFIALKPGLLTLEGPDHCGEIRVADLGLDVRALLDNKGATTGAASVQQALSPRPRNFHKGRAGSVGVLGGAQRHGRRSGARRARRVEARRRKGVPGPAHRPSALSRLQPARTDAALAAGTAGGGNDYGVCRRPRNGHGQVGRTTAARSAGCRAFRWCWTPTRSI